MAQAGLWPDPWAIGACLTEINITSPTGAQQLKCVSGADAAAVL